MIPWGGIQINTDGLPLSRRLSGLLETLFRRTRRQREPRQLRHQFTFKVITLSSPEAVNVHSPTSELGAKRQQAFDKGRFQSQTNDVILVNPAFRFH